MLELDKNCTREQHSISWRSYPPQSRRSLLAFCGNDTRFGGQLLNRQKILPNVFVLSGPESLGFHLFRGKKSTVTCLPAPDQKRAGAR
jgi:hypothetical protein